MSPPLILVGTILSVCVSFGAAQESRSLRESAQAATKKARTFYHVHASSKGGHVYHYSPDLKQHWGKGDEC